MANGVLSLHQDRDVSHLLRLTPPLPGWRGGSVACNEEAHHSIDSWDYSHHHQQPSPRLWGCWLRALPVPHSQVTFLSFKKYLNNFFFPAGHLLMFCLVTVLLLVCCLSTMVREVRAARGPRHNWQSLTSHQRYKIFSPTQSQSSGQLSASTDIQSVITDRIKTNGSNRIVNQS